MIGNAKKFIGKSKYGNLFRPGLALPENRFVIYTRGRTGSTLLSELLNCHPDVFCDVEIFNMIYCRSKVLFPFMYIKSCSKRAAIYRKNVYGFKVKIFQLRVEHKYKNYESILKRLSEEGFKFVYLKRTNFLRHKISNLLTTETQIFSLRKNEDVQLKKIKVDCEILLKGIKYSEEVEKTEAENLRDIPHIAIEYERDLLDESCHQRTAERVFSHLGLENYKVRTEMKRLTGDKLEDVIINYEEVHNFFKDTKYEKFLN